MSGRIFAAILAMFIATQGALAADLASEPVEQAPAKCNLFANYFIWGDPTVCPNRGVPECDAPRVVSAALRFTNRAELAYRVPRVTELVPVREVNQPVFNPSQLSRRYCEGSALLDTGHRTTASYFIEEDAGLVGVTWAIYVCLNGYDSWRVYDGRCRVARPATPD